MAKTRTEDGQLMEYSAKSSMETAAWVALEWAEGERYNMPSIVHLHMLYFHAANII